MSKRRMRWVIPLAVIALAAAGGWLWWQANSGVPPQAWRIPAPVEPEAPALAEPAPADPAEPPAAGGDGATEPSPPAPSLALPESGSLVFESDGRRLGESTYTYARTADGGLQLLSQGTFSFQVAVVGVSVSYRQALRLDAGLRPVSYQSEFHGPLGLGDNQVEVVVDGALARLRSGGAETSVAVAPDGPLFVLGLFSTYGVLPLLIDPAAPHSTLSALLVGGGTPNGPRLDTLSLEIVRLDDWSIGTEGAPRTLARYALNFGEAGGAGDAGGDAHFEVWLEGGQWVGLSGGGEGRELRVYRSDRFPQGLAPFGEPPAGARVAPSENELQQPE